MFYEFTIFGYHNHMKYLWQKLISITYAQVGGSVSGISIENPINAPTIIAAIDRVIDFLILAAAPIVAAMVIFAGFQMLTAGGEPEKFKKGWKTLLYASVGYAIILISKGVASIIRGLF
jgi:hypothetical protein